VPVQVATGVGSAHSVSFLHMEYAFGVAVAGPLAHPGRDIPSCIHQTIEFCANDGGPLAKLIYCIYMHITPAHFSQQ